MRGERGPHHAALGVDAGEQVGRRLLQGRTQQVDRLQRAVEVALEVDQVEVGVALLLTRDLGGLDLVDQLTGALGHLGRAVGGRGDELPEAPDVGVEPVGDRGHPNGAVVDPQRLLEAVEAGEVGGGRGVVEAAVDPRVEVAEGLGDGLDALVVQAGRRVEEPGPGEVAGTHRVGEGGRGRHEVGDLGPHVGAIPLGGGDEGGALVPVRHRLAPGHGERPGVLVGAGAPQQVGALGQGEREPAAEPRGEVLLLRQDLLAAGVEQLGLGHRVGTRVGDGHVHRAGLDRGRGRRAPRGGERDRHLGGARPARGRVLAGAAGAPRHEDQEDDHDRGRGPDRAPDPAGGARAATLRPRHEQHERHQVGEPRDDLDHDGPGLDAEHAREQRRQRGAGTDQPGEVGHPGLTDVEPPGLVGGVERRHDEPGRDHHEHQPGDAEEAGEVEVHAAPVDEQADDHGRGEAEQRADAAEERSGAVLEGGEEEHRGLEPLAQHGQERHQHQRLGGPARERVGRGVLEVPLEVAGVLPHPHDHVGHHSHRDETDDRLEALLLPLGQVLGDDLEGHADGQADRHCGTHAHPDLAERLAPALLREERRHDADDEGRLQPLAEADDEGGEHVAPPGAGGPPRNGASSHE